MDAVTRARLRGTNLPARVATALVLAPGSLLIVWLGGPWLQALVLVVAAICLAELYTSMHKAGIPPAWGPGALGALGLILFWELAPVIMVALWVGSILWSLVADRRQWRASAVGSVVGALYIAAPLAMALELRGEPERGFAWSVILLASVWVCDSGAFFVGIRWGRTKLLPRVSPKKTWEGLYGGLASASLAALVLALLFGLPPHLGALYGLVVGGATAAGDLVESAVKRALRVKDMGELLPGHGGLLDRIDGLLAAIPAGYIIIALFAR